MYMAVPIHIGKNSREIHSTLTLFSYGVSSPALGHQAGKKLSKTPEARKPRIDLPLCFGMRGLSKRGREPVCVLSKEAPHVIRYVPFEKSG
jgi:hypothetical protein